MEWEEGIEDPPRSLPGLLLSLLTLGVSTYITGAFRKIQHLDCVFKVMSSVGFHTNASGLVEAHGARWENQLPLFIFGSPRIRRVRVVYALRPAPLPFGPGWAT